MIVTNGQLALVEALEADVAQTDRELIGLRWELARVSDTEAVSYDHAKQRMLLAYRLRREISRLEACRAEQVAELEAALLGVPA